MSDDAAKIEQIEKTLESEPENIGTETISFALAIADSEDRDLQLLKITELLAIKKDWNRALGAAQLIENGYERTDALHHVAAKLSNSGHLERGLWIFNEAEKEALTVAIEWQQAELLQKLAKTLVEIGATFKAKELLEKSISVARQGQDSSNLQDSLDASSVLAESISIFAVFIGTEKAIALAETIKNNAIRQRTSNNLAKHPVSEKLAA